MRPFGLNKGQMKTVEITVAIMLVLSAFLGLAPATDVTHAASIDLNLDVQSCPPPNQPVCTGPTPGDEDQSITLPPLPAPTGYTGPQSEGLVGCPLDDLAALMVILGRPAEDAKYWVWKPNQLDEKGNKIERYQRMVNGWRYWGPQTDIKIPPGWGGAHGDGWNKFNRVTASEGEVLENVIEANVFLRRCNR